MGQRVWLTEDNTGHAAHQVAEPRVVDVSDKKLQHGFKKDVVPPCESYPYTVTVH